MTPIKMHIPSTTHNLAGDGGLADRLRRYFDRHPEVSREQFLLAALRDEIDAREAATPWYAWPLERPRVREEDVRMHAWLTERLELVNRERYGFWATVRQFFLGGR